MTNRGRTGFIQLKDEVSGQYRPALPEGIDPNDIVDIVLDPHLGTSSELPAQLADLVDGLASGRRPMICGTDEWIQFGSVGNEYWEGLVARVTELRYAVGPSSNRKLLAERAVRLQPLIIKMVHDKAIAPVRGEIEDFAHQVAHLRTIHGADAILAAWAMIYRDLIADIEAACREVGHDDLHTAAIYIRYASAGATPGETPSPHQLIAATVGRAAREGFHSVAASLGDRYTEAGEDFIDQALEAQAMNDFGLALYQAGPLLLAATRIFKNLIAGQHTTVPEDAMGAYAKRANFAEENAVRVYAALLNLLKNRTGGEWQRHKSRIATETAKGGSAGAQQEMLRLIELNYLYPRAWKQYLLDPAIEVLPLYCP